jgi:flagellar protein FliS
MDGALDRIAGARGAIQNGQAGQKARLIHKAVEIINELHASLNPREGGSIAANLGDLYEYMARQLVRANMENRVASLDEVAKLLHEIRSAWIAIPIAARATPVAR